MPDQIKNANYNPLNLDKINDEYEFKFDNANMGVAPPPLVGQEKVAKHHYYENVVVANNAPIVADNVVNIPPNVVPMFNADVQHAVPDWWPKGVVGHGVPGEEEEYIDDGEDEEEDGDELVANKEMLKYKPYPGILPKAFENAIIDNMAPQKENYKKVNLPKPQKVAQYINNAEQAMPHPCDPCDVYGRSLEEKNLKGMMVFYVNTNGMPAEQAMILLEKVSNQYKNICNNLKKNGVEVMWLPTNTGNTMANYFNFQ